MEIKIIEAEPIQDRVFVMGAWRYHLEELQGNIIIANALNFCVQNLGFQIWGYLITRRRLFLIASSVEFPFEEVLAVFYEQVGVGIAEMSKLNSQWKADKVVSLAYEGRLFDAFPLYNSEIKKILTGMEVNLDYYSPHLAKLKAQIHNYNYCSVLDYLGGESPVYVTTI